MRYRIGEVADLFDMTAEGIRFLEKQGIIASKRDPENNYRYFEHNELVQLKRMRAYCTIGFSLKEAYALVNTAAKEEVLCALEQKVSEIDAQIKALRQVKQELAEELAASTYIMSRKAFDIVQSPAFAFFSRPHEKADKAEQKSDWPTQKALARAMPTARLCAVIDREGNRTVGSVLEARTARRLQIPSSPRALVLQSCSCVHGAIEAPISGVPDFTPAVEWAQAQGLRLSGEKRYLLQLSYLKEDGRRWGVHEFYLPIDQESIDPQAT